MVRVAKLLRQAPPDEGTPLGCPLEYVDHPDVAHAATLHRWWKVGSLEARTAGHLTCAEADAIDAIEDGLQARQSDDAERAKARMESARKKGRGRPG